MVQTTQNFNMEFGAGKRMPATSKQGTILTTQGVLAKNTLLMLDPATNKYVIADTDTIAYQITADPTFGTLNNTIGWGVLLEEVDTDSGDIAGEIGVTGEIGEDTIVFAGTNLTAINDVARAILAMNNIFVNKYDNSVAQV
ncbi:MAG: hypothetical protein KAJ19_08205 [Gammaproteobacteria bacterium]|nr:hypothetical protein [Gammaproteobacteria bacterium]